MPHVAPSPDHLECAYRIGETSVEGVVLSVAEIQRAATAIGDPNPLHLDEEFARQSRFGALTASGAHTTGLMMGALARFMTSKAPGFGLEIGFKLKQAVFPDIALKIVWTIDKIEASPKLGGYLVGLGGVLASTETVFIESRATCFIGNGRKAEKTDGIGETT